MPEVQSIDRLILHHVQDRQTVLVNSALEQGFFSEADIKNQLVLEDGTYTPVQQWYLVSEWLAEQLLRTGGIVLMNEYGCWWGILDTFELVCTHEDLARIREPSGH